MKTFGNIGNKWLNNLREYMSFFYVRKPHKSLKQKNIDLVEGADLINILEPTQHLINVSYLGFI